MSELDRLVAEIPEELKALVDSDQRTNREVVEAALWREFGGERMGALERRIEEKERRISMVQSERNERERELQEMQDELQALRAKRESAERQEKAQLEEAREALETVPKEADNPAVKNWANKLNMTPQELLEEL